MTESGIKLQDHQLYGISWDDPEITPVDRCTFEWAAVLSERASRELPLRLQERKEPATNLACIHISGDLNEKDADRQCLHKVRLPERDYLPAKPAASGDL
jgi:DNA gyrase inhibitor GyrI